MGNGEHSCLECLWHDQCEDERICGFFSPIDEDLEIKMSLFDEEKARKEYQEEYQEYISEEA